MTRVVDKKVMNRIILLFIMQIGISACSGQESFVQTNGVVKTPTPPAIPDPASFNISISRSLLAYYSTDHLYLQGQFNYQDSSSIKSWQKHSLEFAPSEITSRTGFSSLSVSGHQVCGVQNEILYCWTDHPQRVDTQGHRVLAVDHADDDICIISSDEELYCKTLAGVWAMPYLFNDSFYGTFLLQEGGQYSLYKYTGVDQKVDVTANIMGEIKDIQTSNNIGCIQYVNEEVYCYGNNAYGQIGPDLGSGVSLRKLELPL